jgi:putative two-component system response regulator
MKSGKERNRTILIVDDDAEWRDFVFRVIGERYPVQYATNGEDALRVARGTIPDAIILDVMLPGGMDGFMVFCELKESPETKDIPIILLTEVNRVMETEVDSLLLDRYFGSAPAAFLEKPVSPDRLLEELERALGRNGKHVLGIRL